jgi:hypothetical protein
VKASFGGDFPAIHIELLFILLDSPIVGDLPVLLEVSLVAHYKDRNIAEIDCLV